MQLAALDDEDAIFGFDEEPRMRTPDESRRCKRLEPVVYDVVRAVAVIASWRMDDRFCGQRALSKKCREQYRDDLFEGHVYRRIELQALVDDLVQLTQIGCEQANAF